MTTKGKISDDMTIENANRLLVELLKKAKNDALNITDEEYDWANRVLSKYIKAAIKWELVKDNLTAKQALRLLEEL